MALKITNYKVKGIPLEAGYINIRNYNVNDKTHIYGSVSIYFNKAVRDADKNNVLETISFDFIDFNPSLPTLPQLYNKIRGLPAFANAEIAEEEV